MSECTYVEQPILGWLRSSPDFLYRQLCKIATRAEEIAGRPRQTLRQFLLARLAEHAAQLGNTLGVIRHPQALLGLVELEFNLPDGGGVRHARGWQGIGTHRDTPVEIIDKLNKEINAGLADPRMKARIEDLSYTVFASSPAEFAAYLAAYTEKWAKVIRFAGIKPE